MKRGHPGEANEVVQGVGGNVKAGGKERGNLVGGAALTLLQLLDGNRRATHASGEILASEVEGLAVRLEPEAEVCCVACLQVDVILR